MDHINASVTVKNKNSSVEYLLKQVYAVYRSEIKDLEAKLKDSKDLQENLKDTYEKRLKEKDEHIEKLQSQIEEAKKNGDNNEKQDETKVETVLLDFEKPSKRKRDEIERNDRTKERYDDSQETRISNGAICTNVDEEEDEEAEWESIVTVGKDGASSQASRVLVPDSPEGSQYDVITNKDKTGDRESIIVAETVDFWTTETMTMPKETETSKKPECYLGKLAENSTGNVANRLFNDLTAPNERFGRWNNETLSQKRTKNKGGSQNVSKYPLYFEKNTKCYRKPKYKQMTLSQNVYGGALATTADDMKRAIRESRETYERKVIDDDESKWDQNGNAKESLDETYIPSQFLRKNSIAVVADVAAPKVQTWNNDEVQMLPEDTDDFERSEDLLSELERKGNCSDMEIRNTLLSNDDLDDFDFIPSKKEKSPSYKYKREVVRKREERRMLGGHECRDCEAYFKEMGLTEGEKWTRLKECSRHRDRYVAPNTPDHFWSIRFPTTQECKERGIVNTTQQEPLRSRRQRQLQQL